MKTTMCYFTSSRPYALINPLLFISLIVAVLALSACGGVDFSMERAVWNADESTLKLRGTGSLDASDLIVSDADSGVALSGFEIRGNDLIWRITIDNLTVPPCRVRVEASGIVAELDVENAPGNCGISDDGGAGMNDVQVFAFNDLGMHCMDEDTSVFAILPPFNTLHAQVIRKGTAGEEPSLINESEAEVRYLPTADPTGSINATSIGKTDFWDHVEALYGLSPEPDVGLLGAKMPSNTNGPQLFSDYDTALERFKVEGIPITPTDDAGNVNAYPMFRIEAHDLDSGTLLSALDVVVPVSTEMNCSNCHNTGEVAADNAIAEQYGIDQWSQDSNAVIQYKENILILHDAKNNTTLLNETPVLCAGCHYSPPLDLAGAGPQGDQLTLPFMSHAIHSHHGKSMSGSLPDADNPPIVGGTGLETCYQCHPGTITQCYRGAMFEAGLACQNCHGGMLAIGGEFTLSSGEMRVPWQDEPKCQSCHTGDALDHLGDALILSTAFDPDDPAAEPTIASNQRFAENPGTLYRNSTGHGGVACSSCHGSPHAIWPVADPTANDNITPTQLQGHAGTISECGTCHMPASLPLTLEGPHGMHNITDERWNLEHEEFYEDDPASCQACHGLTLEGTVLSKTATDRVLRADDDGQTITLAKDTMVACDTCHEMPDEDD